MLCLGNGWFNYTQQLPISKFLDSGVFGFFGLIAISPKNICHLTDSNQSDDHKTGLIIMIGHNSPAFENAGYWQSSLRDGWVALLILISFIRPN